MGRIVSMQNIGMIRFLPCFVSHYWCMRCLVRVGIIPAPLCVCGHGTVHTTSSQHHPVIQNGRQDC
eukprot:10488388-Karenia_brevis.AAC.1